MKRLVIAAAIVLAAASSCLALGSQPMDLRQAAGDFEWAGELPEEYQWCYDNTTAHSGTWSLIAPEPRVENPSNGFIVADTFNTAEFLWSAWVKLEGSGELRILYPGDGRNAIKVIESPTDGWQQITLHLRANPRWDSRPRDLTIFFSFVSPAGWYGNMSGPDSPPVRWDDIEITPLYQHEVPRVTTPPVIDGDLSDACWDDAASIGDPYWRMYNQPRDARMATEVWCCYDDESLYAAFRCQTPDVRRLVSNIALRDGFAWRDDSAEIFFDIGHDHDTYYEFVINPDDVVFDSKWFFEGGNWLTDWNYLGEWKSGFAERAWTVEIRLALESYEERDLQGNPTGYMPLPTGDVAGILFSRNDLVVGEGMSHADCVGSFHEVDQYGHLVGFRPNRIEPYRRTALREVGRLERRWARMNYAAGQPAPIEFEDCARGTVGLPGAIAALRGRVEVPAPSFDEWVAIREEIEELDRWLDEARALLAPAIARRRWPDADWGLGVEATTGGGLQVPEVVEISAARGEIEPVRLVVIQHDAAPRGVSVLPTDLQGAGGRIPATAIRWYAIHGDGSYSARGDRLVPEEPVSTVRADDRAAAWWEVEVPREARPGVYRGEIVTTDGEQQVELPIELTVHDFAMPERRSLALSASFDSEEVARLWYGERAPLGTGEYWLFARELLRHGVMPREMLADMTRWGDGGALSLSLAERMAERAAEMGARWDAFTGARPEHLAGLRDPGGVLDDVLDHWQHALGDRPIPLYVPDGAPVPDRLWDRQVRGGVAAIDPWRGMDEMPPGIVMGTWAVCPDTAAGLGGDLLFFGDEEGAAVARLAGELDRTMAWRGLPDRAMSWSSPWNMRILGWLADDYGIERIFLDDGELERLGDGQVASGLLYCLAGPGEDDERLREPQPTLALKLLREALDDYEYLRMLKRLNGLAGQHQVGDRLWRLRLANDTLTNRNWDMVMSVQSCNTDPAHLMERREGIARQIERTRDWLQRADVEGPLPGDDVR